MLIMNKVKNNIYFGGQVEIFLGGSKQGLSRLCVQRVIWTCRTLFFDSLDTHNFLSEFADDDFY